MEFQNYIGSKWVDGRNGTTFDTVNPVNEKELAHIHAADLAEVELAVQAVSDAYEH